MMRLIPLIVSLLFCAAAAGAAPAPAPVILVLGDSLSAEYGIARNSGWVSLLQRRLEQRKSDYSVINAGLSADTTDGGLARAEDLLARHRPAIVILELGGNDGLRGLSLSATRENLAALIRLCRSRKARVLLIGMKMPPNYGAVYTRRFEENYRELAGRFNIPLVPFLLEGIGEKREWFQADGLHPTAAAQPAILENVWKKLQPMLDAPAGSGRRAASRAAFLFLASLPVGAGLARDTAVPIKTKAQPATLYRGQGTLLRVAIRTAHGNE